jgi:hypothetical protein
MNKSAGITSFVFLLIFNRLSVWATPSGTTSADFLNLGINPRAVAMGEAQVGLADDVYAAYWNPAGLARLQNPEVGFVHTEWVQDIRSEFIAYAHPFSSKGTVAGSLTHASLGKFNAFDAAGLPTGQVEASDTCFALSYARALWSNRRMGSELAIGATTKWLRERLDDTSASAFAADTGLLFSPGSQWGRFLEEARMGVALRHAGSPLKFDRESFDLPTSLSAGLSWTGHWLGEKLTLAADTEKPKEGKGMFGAGVELSSLRLLLLRAGFTTKADVGSGIRFGVGVRLRTLQVDYAYAGLGKLGQTHRFGLTLRLGITPPDPLVLAQNSFAQGMKAYRKSHFSDALVHFNKALEIDSSHPDALRMMKETYEKLKASTAP